MSAEVLPKFRVHPVEDLLERYALGQVSDPLLSRLEAHLVGCETCQQRLQEVDDYVRSFKRAAATLEARHDFVARPQGVPLSGLTPFLSPRTLVWGIAGFMAVLSLVIGIGLRPGENTDIPAVVVLNSLRGGLEGQPTGESNLNFAPAGRTFELRMDASRLPEADGSLEIVIVDVSGAEVWRGAAKVETEQEKAILSAMVLRSFSPGQYWTRLYAGQTLLREFSLQVR